MSGHEPSTAVRPSHTLGPLATTMHTEPEQGPLAFSQDYEQRLRQLVHSPDQLAKAGYVVHQLSPQELAKKKRCVSCSKGNGAIPTSSCLSLD
ncbi:hypothetical protein JDV02_003722 [Purpureocillium takamizusanense]|uniref:Uncharacterized protein n=1 Tax=Purpureocillium takamizusanense TaxID=2060973 RepID=A0A9Q8QB54_9HYPO|nr:uncharacterized protein JDV02_003722 [Purpureocillium takamizusanense]UNI17379.1 hypothetical protein JDV02_003722 [Purpureocillium takamizusanense]